MNNPYQKQTDFLKRMQVAGQLAHAYIFAGQDSEGIQTFVKEFIQSLYCKEGSGKHCGSCSYCKMIEKGAFPDLRVLRSAASDSSIKNETDMREITVEQVREVQNFVSHTSYYGGYKSVIIEHAERMTVEAQNCFLKTLEEPKGKTILCLLSSNPDLLLPTVTSRCQTLKFFSTGKNAMDLEHQKLLARVLEVANADLAVKFNFAKTTNGENLHQILNVLEIYFRNALFSKIGAHLSEKQNMPNYSIPQIQHILKTLQTISRQVTVANINARLALEVVLMELS